MSDRFACADASEQRSEPIVATASQVRGWLLVEVHGAWGVDAIAESQLGSHVPDGWKDGLKRRGIRPICIRPAERGSGAGSVRVFFVVAGRPGRTDAVTWVRTVPDLASVRHLTDDLRLDRAPDGWERHPERLVLVCTNGKHDQCCANRGRPVVRHLRESRWADQVWECSHIGGDRFAANLLVLPDSLYFGRMEPAEAEALLDDHAEGQIALEWFRGRSTLRYGEQAIEHEVRRRHDLRGIDDVVIEPGSDLRRVRVQARGVGTAEMAVERTLGSTDDALTCRGTPNQRIPIFTVSSVDLRSPDA